MVDKPLVIIERAGERMAVFIIPLVVATMHNHNFIKTSIPIINSFMSSSYSSLLACTALLYVMFIYWVLFYNWNIVEMNQHEHGSEEDDDNVNLMEDSAGMNQDQQALFLNFARSKSADSFLGKILPHPNEVPQRSLVWEMTPTQTLTNNIIINTHRPLQETSKQQKITDQQSRGLHIFKKVRKEKVRSKCDYDKNICGYITKKVIREFVSKNYQKQVGELIKKYNSNYAECKGYYLRKVQLVTGPSHLPQLFVASPNQPESIASCKKVFKNFYRWFLKQRYLRYLLVQGKMSNKQAYIEYKNTNLFKYVQDDQHSSQIDELQSRIQTRSRSAVKIQKEEE